MKGVLNSRVVHVVHGLETIDKHYDGFDACLSCLVPSRVLVVGWEVLEVEQPENDMVRSWAISSFDALFYGEVPVKPLLDLLAGNGVTEVHRQGFVVQVEQ